MHLFYLAPRSFLNVGANVLSDEKATAAAVNFPFL